MQELDEYMEMKYRLFIKREEKQEFDRRKELNFCARSQRVRQLSYIFADLVDKAFYNIANDILSPSGDSEDSYYYEMEEGIGTIHFTFIEIENTVCILITYIHWKYKMSSGRFHFLLEKEDVVNNLTKNARKLNTREVYEWLSKHMKMYYGTI